MGKRAAVDRELPDSGVASEVGRAPAVARGSPEDGAAGSPSAPLWIFLLGILVLIPSVWLETSITGKDEYWLSLRTPMEMLERDSWLTPWLDGQPRLQKPPLLYWAIWMNYRLFGVGLLAARIWGVLFGAGLAAGTCLLYRELFRKSGALAGLMVLSTMAVAVEGRRAMLDLPLAFFTLGGVYFAIRWGNSRRWNWLALSSVSLGLSFLTKGPIGLLFFASAAFTALWISGKWQVVLSLWRHVLGAAVMLALICVPWPLLMAYQWPDFASTIVREMGEKRFGRISPGSPFSALGNALGLVFPWSAVLVAAVAGVLKRPFREKNRKTLWLTAWCLASVVPFFFFRSFGRYMLPIIPAVCLLCAHWIERAEQHWKRRLVRLTACMTAVLAVPACVFCIWFRLQLPAAVLGICLAMGIVWLSYRATNPRNIAAGLALMPVLLLGVLYPAVGIGAMPGGIEAWVREGPGAVYEGTQPSMLSMRLGRSVVRLRSQDLAGPAGSAGFRGVLFMEERHVGGFETTARRSGIAFEKIGEFETFFSRKAWIRFQREGAGWAEWKAAIKTRSLSPLTSHIWYYRIDGEKSHD